VAKIADTPYDLLENNRYNFNSTSISAQNTSILWHNTTKNVSEIVFRKFS